MRIAHVVGARPNFMKAAPVIAAFRAAAADERIRGGERIEQILVHTGQHYAPGMSGQFFTDLELPSPDVNLGVGSGSHGAQTAQIMTRFEEVCIERKPGLVLVVGDVNSTLAGALVAAKLGIPVVHVEAGLRSFDRRMPEEINRRLTDAVADILFTTEQAANENLDREGIPRDRVAFVGNVMIDTLLRFREKAERSAIGRALGLEARDGKPVPYAVLTLHRPHAVDDPAALGPVLEAVVRLSRDLPIVFPVHPRTRKNIVSFGFGDLFDWRTVSGHDGAPPRGILAVEPLGYLDFLHLESHANLVLTDSGGIQEETTILGVPCVTLRDETERPVTITHGTNVLAGLDTASILAQADIQLSSSRAASSSGPAGPGGRTPPLWDGRAAQRIVDMILSKRLRETEPPSVPPQRAARDQPLPVKAS